MKAGMGNGVLVSSKSNTINGVLCLWLVFRECCFAARLGYSAHFVSEAPWKQSRKIIRRLRCNYTAAQPTLFSLWKPFGDELHATARDRSRRHGAKWSVVP